MKRLITLAVMLGVLGIGIGPAFAAVDPPKGQEGPGTRAKVPPKGVEGPDIRQSTMPQPKGLEGPDIR